MQKVKKALCIGAVTLAAWACIWLLLIGLIRADMRETGYISGAPAYTQEDNHA